MVTALLLIVAGLLVVCVGLLVSLHRRPAGDPVAALSPRLDFIERANERTEGALREELAKTREESGQTAHHLREEITGSLERLSERNEKRLTDLRGTVDERLLQISDQSAKKLDEMRQTVDEKLQGTLEKRLGEAFQQVSERLEAVHQGLGEMQNLANGVGDLKKVLTNVKARGTWGEVQLGELLDQVMTPDQYARNVATKRGSAERVEFAVKLPGREEGDETVYLPIDAKFPQEDYVRLVESEEQGDVPAADAARRSLEARLLAEGRKIRDKYLNPPTTTDFGLMFLPTEGLAAEVLRRTDVVEKLQRDCRVVVVGPTMLWGLLNSLQMGFRTLAVQKRSSEVWKTLGAVKTQFGAFSGLLDKVQDKLQQASNQIETAAKKSRNIERKLGKVEELPVAEATTLLPLETEES